MEWLDILARIAAGEDRHTEFKRGLGDLSAIAKAICAFANTDGGVVNELYESCTASLSNSGLSLR